MEKLVLIDGNSLLNRAYYATPMFTSKSGLPTNGIFGFVKLLLKIISDKKPAYLAVAFDLHAPTFRHEMYAEYKAGRKPMPEELVVQVPVLKELLALMKIKICELEGYEADDIIGTLAKRFPVQTYIYTGDRDAYQLVDDTTNVCYTRKGVSDILELSSRNFKEEVGLIPAQIVDLKALMGDKSDNIPGVTGIGEKSAYRLLEEYGSLDGVYGHLDEIKGALSKKLTDHKEEAYFSQFLATIKVDSPIPLTLSDCVLRMPFPHTVREKFAELDFRSMISLPIFDENGQIFTEREAESLKIKNIEEVFPADINSALSIYESAPDLLACDWVDDGFRFFCSDGDDKEYVIPIKENLLDVGFFIHSIKPFFEKIFTGKKKIVLYNSKEIRHRLSELDIKFSAPFEDVSLMKYIAEGTGNSDNLDFCLNYYSLPVQNRAYGIYRLYKIFKEDLDDAEKKLYLDIELPLSTVLYDMEQTGVWVDWNILNEFSVKYNAELKRLTESIYRLAGEKFNINSPKQLGDALFVKLGLPSGKKTKTGYSTNAEILEKLRYDHPAVELVLHYRTLTKLKSTYADGLMKEIREDGRIHTTFQNLVTATGRLSSTEPNLQNIPVRTDLGAEIRKMFIPKPGCVLVDADYSQIELRVLAHIADDTRMQEAFRSGEDFHAVTASQVFGVPLESVTPLMRRHAKAVNFGIVYGISAFSLSQDIGVTVAEAKEYMERYFATYTGVRQYMEQVVSQARERGYVETLWHRRRALPELKSSNFNMRSFGERVALNMPIQGTAADIIKLAMVRVHRRLAAEGLEARLIMQVHDELIVECPEAEASRVEQLLQQEMQGVAELSVPLLAEAHTGHNWLAAKG